jgi:hypothetical protein
MLSGQMESAKRLCDTFTLLVNLDTVGDGRVRASYYQTNPIQRDYNGSVPITYGAQIYSYDVLTGNLAFQIIALGRFYHHTNDYKYLQTAIKIAKFINNNLKTKSIWGGFYAGFQFNVTTGVEIPLYWRSIEHNIDVYGAALLLYGLTGDTQWQDMMNTAKTFITQMYNSNGGFYYVGTTNDNALDNYVTAYPTCDAQTWSSLSEADTNLTRRTNALNWVLNNLQLTETQQDSLTGKNIQYNGVIFSSGGTGIQSEQTAAAAMALYAHGQAIATSDPTNSKLFIDAADKFLQTLLDMQKYALRSDGHGIVAAVNPNGATVWPGDELAGESWRYYPLLHTAASAWTGLALQYIRNGNIYANPFADYSQMQVNKYLGVNAASTQSNEFLEEKAYSIGIVTLVMSIVLGVVVLAALIVLAVLNIRLYNKNKEIEKLDRGSRQELLPFTQLGSPSSPIGEESPRQ